MDLNPRGEDSSETRVRPLVGKRRPVIRTLTESARPVSEIDGTCYGEDSPSRP